METSLSSLHDAMKKFQRECYVIAETNGFQDENVGPESGRAYLNQMGNALMLIVGEVNEAHDELRSGHPPHRTYYKGESPKPEGVPSELADIVIRVADFAETYGIDLGRAIEDKMAYNKTRTYRHGGKKF